MQRQMENEAADEAVPLAYARALIRQVQRQGCDPGPVLERAGLGSEALLEEQRGLSAEAYSRLCRAVLQLLGDETGGLLPGLPAPPGMTRMLLLSVLHCATLEEVLERAIEFNAALRESLRPHHRLLCSDGQARLVYRPSLPAPQQALALCSMAVWLRMCGWLIGRDIDVLHAGVAGPLEPHRAALQHFFRCPIAARQEANHVAFPARYLRARPGRSEGELEQFLLRAAHWTVIRPLRAEGPMGRRLRSRLEQLPCDQWPDFAALAAQLHMAPRTLRRRLAMEGDGFQRLCDRIRCERAVAALRTGCSVEEVAVRAGFSDSSAFHRAFRRWTGVSPGQFRGLAEPATMSAWNAD